jgi:hypothetical protein
MMPEICSFSQDENYFAGRRDVGCDKVNIKNIIGSDTRN